MKPPKASEEVAPQYVLHNLGRAVTTRTQPRPGSWAACIQHPAYEQVRARDPSPRHTRARPRRWEAVHVQPWWSGGWQGVPALGGVVRRGSVSALGPPPLVPKERIWEARTCYKLLSSSYSP